MMTLEKRVFANRRIVFLAALLAASLALAPGLWAAAVPSVTVSDQAVRDGSIVVAEVASSGPGWIVIHSEAAGKPGPVAGYAKVADGANRDVIVKIDTAVATPRLFAMLHLDAGTVGVYEFPGADKPVMVDGKMVSPPFSVTGLAPRVTARDQAPTADTVSIAEVLSAGPGWLVVHAEANGAPGPVVGYAAVPDGLTRDLAVKIDAAKATAVLYAMLHVDAGAVGTYEFPGPDKPAMVNGKMVSPPFRSAAPAAAAAAPVIDGAVAPGEYAYTKDFGQLAFSMSRTADTLFLAVAGRTAGWVAVGTGSQRMDGATIFIGFVDKDGKVQLKPQVGQGHSHSDTAQAVADTVAASAMRESGGVTTLEIALKSSAYVATGQDSLSLILAVGPDDSFSPRHSFRTALSVPLTQ
jgi:hypothetical protein